MTATEVKNRAPEMAADIDKILRFRFRIIRLKFELLRKKRVELKALREGNDARR